MCEGFLIWWVESSTLLISQAHLLILEKKKNPLEQELDAWTAVLVLCTPYFP